MEIIIFCVKSLTHIGFKIDLIVWKFMVVVKYILHGVLFKIDLIVWK